MGELARLPFVFAEPVPPPCSMAEEVASDLGLLVSLGEMELVLCKRNKFNEWVIETKQAGQAVCFLLQNDYAWHVDNIYQALSDFLWVWRDTFRV